MKFHQTASRSPFSIGLHQTGRRVSVVTSIVLQLTTAFLFGISPNQDSREPESRLVKVSARRFKFTPARIRVRQGEVLKIELSSRDVMHGFEILDTDIDVRIPPRKRGHATVLFEAHEKGKFPFRCSHKCGAGHASMRGVIIVE